MGSDGKQSRRASKEDGSFGGSFFAALQFLTLAPPVIRRPFTARELGGAVGFYPLVGALAGALLYGVNLSLDRIFPPLVTAAITLAIWVLLSGALHLDGFLDACDGLLGGSSPQSRLEIMHDEQVGAFGLTGGVLLLLIKYAALASLPSPGGALLAAPILGRWGMTLAISGFPYARPEGLGRVIKDNAGGKEVLLASITALAVGWLTGSWLGLAAAGLVALVVWISGTLAVRRIPGLTGDVYGAINELGELVVLLTFSAAAVML